MDKFIEYREKYKDFIYKKFTYEIKDKLEIKYYFEIPGLMEFTPEIKISKDTIINEINKEYLEYLIGQIGLIELISYVKATCSKNIYIDAMYIDEEQIKFLKKTYYNGLGELLYTNNISISEEELFNINCRCSKNQLPKINYQGQDNLICVGGGKDSCVTLEILKNEQNNSCLLINPKNPQLKCAEYAEYNDKNIVKVERILDKKIIELNNRGFLNGHTPLSALIAQIAYLCAYLQNKKNIVLSNESSANQATVIGTNINHQYSKTYEFEIDFNKYMSHSVGLEIKYFSLLRGLSEYNIAKIFSNYKKYHKIFKSCNLGSKNENWKWCCNCPKCLFIYVILSPFTTKEERINIFGQDLYERKDLLETFKSILGYTENKPFECVGTYEEARLAVSKTLEKNENGYLLDFIKNNYDLEFDRNAIEKYNEENNLDEYYNNLVKKELDKYV